MIIFLDESIKTVIIKYYLFANIEILWRTHEQVAIHTLSFKIFPLAKESVGRMKP